MDQPRIITDPEEIKYARKVAVTGNVLSHEGSFYYFVSQMKFFKNLPGIVKVGCVVETEKERDAKQGEDQDLGTLKIMLFALFDDKQFSMLSKEYPDVDFVKLENHKEMALLLSWQEYKNLVKV